jgi:threonyl-tRNA synthetase
VEFAKEEGKQVFERMGEFLKCELIEEKADPVFSAYRTGKFLDFCRGPHLPSTGRIKAIKLTGLAGAYWKGDEHSHPMQRIYGTAFFSQKDLEAYLHQIEEAKKRDHRRLGKDLDLFSIQEDAGPGLVFWHPKGGLIRREIEDWLRAELESRGYDLVFTPHVMRLHLWEISGAEADELPRPYSDLQVAGAQLSRAAHAAGGTRHRLPLRALGSDARAVAGARVHAG